MSPEACDEGIKIKISSYKRQTNNLVSRSKVNGNYVTSIMALQEAMQEGFDEAIYSSDGSKKPFFNLGRKNNYKNLLSKETTKEIEDAFNKEMVELGYL